MKLRELIKVGGVLGLECEEMPDGSLCFVVADESVNEQGEVLALLTQATDEGLFDFTLTTSDQTGRVIMLVAELPQPSWAERLSQVMDRVYRFSYNQSLYSIFQTVYGDDQSEAYIAEKTDQIARRGFGSWFCDLDLQNRRAVAKMVIDRYPELRKILQEAVTESGRESEVEKSWEGVSQEEREKLVSTCAELIRDGSFGDGLEDDYSRDGVTIQGANEMTREEVEAYIKEYGE